MSKSRVLQTACSSTEAGGAPRPSSRSQGQIWKASTYLRGGGSGRPEPSRNLLVAGSLGGQAPQRLHGGNLELKDDLLGCRRLERTALVEIGHRLQRRRLPHRDRKREEAAE